MLFMKLIKLDKSYQRQLTEMLDEWTSYNKQYNTNHSPYAIFKNDYHDFDYYLDNLDITNPKEGFVPDSTYFLYDEERDIFIGAANIRHYLNKGLLETGGHIGDGIRPSERKKGYGTLILKLALEKCKELGIDRVLVTCLKSNIGSAKCIQNNHGIKENEVLEDGEVLERYWIDNK